MVIRRRNTGIHIIPMERTTRHQVALHDIHLQRTVPREEKQPVVVVHVQFYKQDAFSLSHFEHSCQMISPNLCQFLVSSAEARPFSSRCVTVSGGFGRSIQERAVCREQMSLFATNSLRTVYSVDHPLRCSFPLSLSLSLGQMNVILYQISSLL